MKPLSRYHIVLFPHGLSPQALWQATFFHIWEFTALLKADNSHFIPWRPLRTYWQRTLLSPVEMIWEYPCRYQKVVFKPCRSASVYKTGTADYEAFVHVLVPTSNVSFTSKAGLGLQQEKSSPEQQFITTGQSPSRSVLKYKSYLVFLSKYSKPTFECPWFRRMSWTSPVRVMVSGDQAPLQSFPGAKTWRSKV